MKRALVAVGFAAAALFGAGTAHADSQDDTFIKALNIMQISYGTDADGADLGRTICKGFYGGMTYSQLTKAGTGAGYTNFESGEVVGAAVGIYCPQYKATMLAQEQQTLVDASGS